LKRRDFVRRLLASGISLPIARSIADLVFPEEADAAATTIAVALKGRPGDLVRRAVNALGGMGRFVKPGDVVVVKPCIAWARTPEQASNTNPDVVAELVRMCKEAGAKEVLVFDHTIDNPRDSYEKSGIEEAARRAGARVIRDVRERPFKEIKVSKGKILNSMRVEVVKEVLEADVLINVPASKNHSAAILSLGMKNLMGTVRDRQAWHNTQNLHQCIADFLTAVRPNLTVLDATRILLTGGPKGPGRVKEAECVVAGVDPVAVDSYGATLFGMSGSKIPYIVAAKALGVGELDLNRIQIKKA
jgi:uncharacterized protein (DUF362 family)